ncbi:lipopolysaccharide assembly protein LapB [Ideonella sp. A 288]|uniref:tetratricopeptide repeat protein n=1 Tax=Ideonella sp. A 288 TaxID=1962181 RepID=UPI000B4A622C|nr:tetratricopeptide repeat protein [Ideonella sp. A 288]
MNRHHPFRLALRRPLAVLLLAAFTATAGAQPAPAAPAASAPAGPTVRVEVGKPLQEAQALLKAKDGKGALAQVALAEAVPALTSYEAYAIQRIKGVAALEAGDTAMASASLEASLASQHLPATDKLPLTDVIVRLAIQAKDYPRAITWLGRYKDLGGADAALRRALPQLLAETGDFAGSVREARAIVAADEAAGLGSPETLLRNLAFAQNKLGDNDGYVATLERLAQQHPKVDYWADLISRVERKPGFDGNRLRLDAYRLMRAVGLVLEPDELADMAARAQQVGLPAEAQALLDEGFGAGALGKGKEGPAHVKLREQATKAAAVDRAGLAESEKAALAGKDGNALVSLGFAMSGAGLHDKAVSLTEQGIAKGGLRRPDEALLHQGIVQWRAGRKDDAVKAFAAVKGGDGAADLARVWSLFVTSAKKP